MVYVIAVDQQINHLRSEGSVLGIDSQSNKCKTNCKVYCCRYAEKIEFRVVNNLQKIVLNFTTKPRQPAKLLCLSPTSLMYRDSSSSSLVTVDCRSSPPCQRPLRGKLPKNEITDMCFVDGEDSKLIVVVFKDGTLCAFSAVSSELQWQAKQKMPHTRVAQQPLRAGGVTADGRGHLLVSDLGNKWVQKFSLDGGYLGRVVSVSKTGQGDLVCPILHIRWLNRYIHR